MSAAAIVLLASACYSGANAGGSGDPQATDTATAGDGDGASEGGSGDDDGDPADACESPQRRLALLSNRRYGNAVRDLLGLPEAPLVSNGGGTHATLLPAGPDQVGDALAFEYNGIAHAAAEQADLAALAPCGGGDERACAGTFIDDFGARAFRRPLTAAEHDGLLAVYDVGLEQDGNYAGGIRLVIATVLQAPTFLYLSELGEESDDGDFELTPWEVAAQISFFLLDSVPDEGLREAAADGRLADDEGVTAEVDRLLATQAVKDSVTSIYLRWLGSARVLEAEKQAPEFTDELQQSMAEETSRFMDDLIWTDDGTLEQMLTRSTTWVDAPLAEFYGLPAPAGEGFSEVELPAGERRGVLTHASLLASLAGVEETSVVHRGLFVARDILCMQFAAPPPGAANTPLEGIEGQRALAEYRMSTSPCSGCHAQFDTFGLLFEHYDELGRYRSEIDGTPVDASADIIYPEAVAGTATDILELAPDLATAEEVAACATERFTAYAVQRTIDNDLDCRVDELTAAFMEADGNLVELVRLIATSRILRTRGGS